MNKTIQSKQDVQVQDHHCLQRDVWASSSINVQRWQVSIEEGWDMLHYPSCRPAIAAVLMDLTSQQVTVYLVRTFQ